MNFYARFIFGAIVCLLPTVAGASSTRSIQQQYQLALEGKGDLVFTADEIALIAELMADLPKKLRAVASKGRPGYLRITKNYEARPYERSPAPFSLLYWQAQLQLGHVKQLRKAVHPDRIKRYQTAFQREVLRVLLEKYDAINKVSRKTNWRSISGFRYRNFLGVQLPLLREALNQDPRAFVEDEAPDNPSVDFVSFGTHFFKTTDSAIEDSIKCRTPAKYEFFKREFPTYKPYLDQDHIRCRQSDEGFLDDLVFFDPLSGKPFSLGKFDASTVDGFELLYATPGVGDAAEIAGHLLLRIRMRNNPVAERLGMENPNDIVISFLADTQPATRDRLLEVALPDEAKFTCEERSQIFAQVAPRDEAPMAAIWQALRGLAGGYLTIFDRQTLFSAIKTYTVDQDRNLLRYELQLTEEQKASLIERLYTAKKNFRTPYYFFDRNCASVLVQVIGEGIGSKTVAEFDPIVSPPSSLVALFIREGLAKPIYPAFYSYRRRGYVAQDALKQKLTGLEKGHPKAGWPSSKALIESSASERAKAVEQLASILAKQPELTPPVYELLALMQEAELAHVQRDDPCDEATTKATASARKLQRNIMVNWQGDLPRVAVNKLVEDKEGRREAETIAAGTSFTGLTVFGLGLGNSHLAGPGVKDRTGGTFSLTGSIYRQDMGPLSSYSMQRATSVRFVSGDITYGIGEGTFHLRRWSLTGLHVRKFKERLGTVAPLWSSMRRIGIGLKLFRAEAWRDLSATRMELGGGEILFNIWGGQNYDNHLFLSQGAEIVIHLSRSGDDTFKQARVSLPLELVGQGTWGNRRQWRLQARVRGMPELVGGHNYWAMEAATFLQFRIPAPEEIEMLLRIGGEYRRWRPIDAGRTLERLDFNTTIDVARW